MNMITGPYFDCLDKDNVHVAIPVTHFSFFLFTNLQTHRYIIQHYHSVSYNLFPKL